MNLSHKAARIEKRSSDPGSLPLQRRRRAIRALKNLGTFDYLVLAGALVNLCVISAMIGFWLAGR
jgi:hypothetical protein